MSIHGTVPLSSLVMFMKNGTTAGQNQEGRGLPVTRIETIADGTINLNRVRHVELTDDDAIKWSLAPGDILLSHINSVEHIGKSAIYVGVPSRLIHGMNLLLLRPNQNVVLPEFLHFGLRSAGVRAKMKARCKQAVNQASINQKELGQIELTLPKLDEQHRMVDLLSRAEGIVRLRSEAQQKAAELVPAIFLEMFGDPASNSKHWPLAKIESICEVKTGATPLRERKDFYENGTVPWIKTGEVKNGEIFDAEERITDLAVSSTNCKVFPTNTILIAMYGQGQTRGRCGILKVPASTNQACVAILPSEHIRHPYLFELFRLQYERLRAMGRGGNQANLNMGMIKTFEVPIPPENLQLEFERRIQFASSIQRQQESALAISERVFASLLGKSFS